MLIGICLAWQFIGEKTNKIPATQKLLRLMDLRDTIVAAGGIQIRRNIRNVGYSALLLKLKNISMCSGIHKSKGQDVIFNQIDQKPIRFDMTFPEAFQFAA